MDNAAELIKLARERFGVLSAADEKLLSAVARGENADFSSDSNEDNDPAQAQDWSEERAFNAYRIAWLCTDAPASALVTHRGIRLELARIDENLDLDWAKVPFPLIFRRCAFSGPISLRFAKVPWLSFVGTHPHALNADGLKVEGDVFLTGGFKAEGEVRLLGATIGGNLECDGGTFTNPEGRARSADGLKVEGSVFLRDGFKAEGEVDFRNGAIVGYFVYRDAVGSEKAILDLRSTRVGTLWDDEASWPRRGNLFLKGLEYREIGPEAPQDAKRRLDWLHRQPVFEPQPYRHLAGVLRASGQRHEATKILVAAENDHRRLGSLSRWRRIVNWFYGATLDHGYRPQKAFMRFAPVFLIVGTVLFWLGNDAALFSPRVNSSQSTVVVVGDQYPRFDPIVYSIDAFVPVINLHQETYWLPDANADTRHGYAVHWGDLLRWYHWVHISLGWLLSFLLVAGLSGLVRKD